jgi:uroporphyrinogen decarboxylase
MNTSKEISMRALRREKADKTPVGIFLGGSWPIINAGLTLESLIGDAKKTAAVFLDVNERLDADIIMAGTGSTALLIKALGGEVRFDEKGAPQILSELIRNEADLRSLSVESAIQDTSVRWLADTSRYMSEYSKKKKLILASGRAPFTLATQLYGLEKFSKAIFKNPEFVGKLLAFTTELSLAYFKLMIQEGAADGAFIADPSASGDVISKKHFSQFVLPYLKKVVEGIKTLHRPVMLHICGDISDRLELLPDTGIDSLSVDTKVDLTNAFNAIGNKISIAGNVDPVGTLEFGTDDEVEKAVSACLEKVKKMPGFILLPGCDVAGNVPEKNLKAFVESARKETRRN